MDEAKIARQGLGLNSREWCTDQRRSFSHNVTLSLFALPIEDSGPERQHTPFRHRSMTVELTTVVTNFGQLA